MTQDYTARLRELVEELRHEEGRIQIVGRALTDAELRRVDALREARGWLERALNALEGAPPPREGHAGVMRGDPEDTVRGGPGHGYARGEAVGNAGLAGDDDTPGYGRGGLAGDDDPSGYGRGGRGAI